MPVSAEYLTDFSIRKFCNLHTKGTPYNEYLYLLNSPIRGINPVRSENKIPIGNSGFLRYLNTVSYNLGYIFELAKSCTTVYPTHILVGNIQSEVEHIGDVTTLYCDNNITILNNKRHSSYLILPVPNVDIPQPII